LLFVVRDLVLERALKRFDVDGMLDKLGCTFVDNVSEQVAVVALVPCL